MSRSAAVFTAAIIIATAAGLFPCARVAAQQGDPFSLEVVNIAEDQEFLSRLEKEKKALENKPEFAEELPEKVPPDHWAYRAVKYLADAGVINGDTAKKFKGDKPVSKAELLAAVKKLLENYDRLVKEGKIAPPADEDAALIEKIRKAAAARYIAPGTTPERAQPPAPIISTPAKTVRAQPPAATIPPPIQARSVEGIPALFTPVPAKTPLPPMSTMPWPAGYRPSTFNPLDTPIQPPDLGLPLLAPRASAAAPANLRRGRPQTLEEPVKTEEAEKKDESEDDKKKDDDDKKSSKNDKAKKDEKKKEIKVPKQFDKLGKTLEKEEIELTQKDVEMLEAIVDYVEKDVVKTKVGKDISDVKRIAQTNERDIQRLEEQNQRFKVTGGGTVQYERTTKEYKLKDLRTTNHPGEPSGTPWKSLSANFYSKPRKFDDMTMRWSGSITSSSDMKISYQDFTTDKIPRNFKLRTIYAGRMSFGASPLTTLGRDMDGFYTELKLNDYSLKGAIGTHSGDSNIFINAASLQFNLFGEPRSWAYISRISSYNKRYSDTGSMKKWGWWYNGESWIYLPPEKNSVVSFYTRYPMPVEGLYMTAEYAHSTYYRPGFKLGFPQGGYNESDCAGKSDDDKCNSWDEYWEYAHDFSNKMAFQKWLPIPDLREQDDSFFVLFDYNKGPIQIFPLGYVHLGNKFVSKYLGLPGFSADDFGIDMLPINLQSLQIMVLMGNYKKLEDNYKWDFLAVSGGETKPMFFDSSAMGSDMKEILKLNFIARVNNRPLESTLKLNYLQNKFTYYLSDDITLSAEYSNVNAALPKTCIDANIPPETTVNDDFGNAVGMPVGNGNTNCNQGSPDYDPFDLLVKLRYSQRSQKYNLFWRTSKKSEFSMDYGLNDSRIAVETNNDEITSALNDLVPQGKKYYMNFNYKYRLTDVSRLEFWYNKDYPRADISLGHPDAYFQEKVGMNINMSY